VIKLLICHVISNSGKMKTFKLLFLLFFVIACSPGNEEKNTTEVPGLDLSNMDQTVDPKADFYQFANGNWLKKTEIPGTQGAWGGFSELGLKTRQDVLNILQNAGKSGEYADGTDQKKAIDYFSVGMDSTLAENVGLSAIKSWYDKIDAIQNKDEVQKMVAELQKKGYRPFGGVRVGTDMMNSEMNALYLGAGGLGLPNRDYYTKKDSKSEEIRNKYVAHVAEMLRLSGAGGEDFDSQAANIMKMETDLAMVSKTPIQRRDRKSMYNPMTISAIQELAPAFKWNEYLTDLGAQIPDTIIVNEPEFLAGESKVINDYPLDNIKSYLKWNVIDRAAPYLNHELVQADFNFGGKVLRGTPENNPRWERVLGATNRALGEAVGKMYVEENFPPEAKSQALEMVNNLKLAFENRIKNLPWMSDSTKEMALKKLQALTVKIGYPDKWRDYSKLRIETAGEKCSFLANVENSAQFEFEEDMGKIGEPVDKGEWNMSPQTVNAYSNSTNNEIVFPAAILQPPFFNFNADPAVNYGGMGAVIGHEISHGFDDQGSRFDAKGNMVNWWTDEDRARFEARTKMLVNQYDHYQPLDSVNVQGALTLGENIGDLGGLNAAYDALQIHFQNHEKPGPIDGYTQEQRFFLSWATIWRTKYRDETLRTQILTNPHSPGMFRAVGPLENMETFYQAFDIKQGDQLWKPDSLRVKIW